MGHKEHLQAGRARKRYRKGAEEAGRPLLEKYKTFQQKYIVFQ
jgi:hypothetical protein